jgi:anti-sigma factor RsiW
MKSQEEQIWQYLDGELNTAERSALEQRLPEDHLLYTELQTRQILHQHLQQTEAEQPSLRFVKNVMDSLPFLYQKAIEPLIRPIWIKVFWGGLAIFIIGLLLYAVAFANVIAGSKDLQKLWIAVLKHLPLPFFTFLLILSFGFLLFVILDKQLKNRFKKVENV